MQVVYKNISPNMCMVYYAKSLVLWIDWIQQAARVMHQERLFFTKNTKNEKRSERIKKERKQKLRKKDRILKSKY